MFIKKDHTDGLYGFGAAAREANTAQIRRNTHTLSIFAAALSSAIIAVMFALLPINAATANPLVNIMGTSANNIGVVAMAAFSLSATVCAIMLLAPTLNARNCRRRNHRHNCQRRTG